MKTSDTLVSVILPIYNAESFLAGCIESLLAQTHTDLEIIAIDDFSKDGSYAILQKYKKQDKRLKVSRNVKRYGLSVTLNRCIKQTKGRYIAFMNATDIATPDRLKRQISYLGNNPKTVAVGTQCLFIDKNQKKISKSDFPLEHEAITKTMLNSISLQYESVLINRFLLPKDLLKFEDKKYPFIYADLIVKMTQYGGIANVKQNLYYRLRQEHSYLRTIKQHYLPHIILWMKARFMYDQKLSLGSLFTPFAKQV